MIDNTRSLLRRFWLQIMSLMGWRMGFLCLQYFGFVLFCFFTVGGSGDILSIFTYQWFFTIIVIVHITHQSFLPLLKLKILISTALKYWKYILITGSFNLKIAVLVGEKCQVWHIIKHRGGGLEKKESQKASDNNGDWSEKYSRWDELMKKEMGWWYWMLWFLISPGDNFLYSSISASYTGEEQCVIWH